MSEVWFSAEAWIAFLTLTALELVLGIDNVIFLSILVDKLPASQREVARRWGLFLAMFLRVALLLALSSLLRWVEPLFSVLGQPISGRDLILIGGGLFLVGKSTHEIHGSLEGPEGPKDGAGRATFASVLLQIVLVDLVFSLDSIITAAGMVEDVRVMIAAVVVSVALMMAFANPIGRFVSAHPTVKMLALSFLVVVGVMLIAAGFDHHVPKGYVYFAMAFSLGVELLNLRLRRRATRVVQLHSPYTPAATAHEPPAATSDGGTSTGGTAPDAGDRGERGSPWPQAVSR